MNLTRSLLAAALASLSGLTLAPAPAAAGSLDNAALACLVDTYYFDILTNDVCFSSWTPGSADYHSIAYFEVVGLPSGSYSYTWNHAPTSTQACSTFNYCTVPISAHGWQTVHGQVTVRDLATGEQRTLNAYAHYFDGWH